MAQVYINGVLLISGIDYNISDQSISFARPPDAGSIINIMGGPGQLVSMVGNGKRYLFNLNEQWSDYERIQDMLHVAWRHKDVPAVADQLEKLKVVLELINKE